MSSLPFRNAIGNDGSHLPIQSGLMDALVSRLNDFVPLRLDNEGRFTSWHPGVAKLLGYRADEFIGHSSTLLLPEREHAYAKIERELREAEKNGSHFSAAELVTKTGDSISVESLTVALHNADGTLAGFSKILRDLTKFQEAVNSTRALAGAIEQSNVLIRRLDGTIEHWTSGCTRLFGWSSEEARGQLAHELLKTAFPKPVDDIQTELLETGTWQGELHQIRKDGSPVDVSAQWVIFPHYSLKEEPYVIATYNDITSRLEMQRELESANDRLKRMANELERSNEELEEFARIASHDLSAPITTTRWLADLLATPA